MKKNFPKRRSRYEHELKKYDDLLTLYNRQKAEYNKQLKDLNSPENIAAYRKESLLNAVKATQSYDFRDSKAQEGYSEKRFNDYLKKYFGNKIHKNLAINIPNFSYPYTPDFSYIDPLTNLHIDIEIDEPYTYKKSEPIHYQGKDNQRNQYFLDRGWIVVRFCEEQIVKYPDGCCKVIAQVISETLNDNDNLIISKFKNIQQPPNIPQWTELEAINMAKNKYRKTYL